MNSCIIRNFKFALRNTLINPLVHVGLLEFVAKRIKYQEIVLIDNRKCANKIWRYIWIKKNTFQKLNRILKKNMIFSLKNKERMLNYYVISMILYGSKCRAISSQIKRRLVVTNRFYRILKVSLTENMGNEELIRRAETKKRYLYL